ncbi:hypothetical protein [Actinomycetospora sp. CA-053990]|uniref:hypothetical protein n=1 Tax=Actinomycetospora sp. CA-053990 TaxID=3239891 RepID=UPI003D91C31B
MMVLVVLGVVAMGLALAWELRFVALWLLVRAVDAVEGADAAGRRQYGDFRRIVAEKGLAGVDLAWLASGDDDRSDAADRADWQLRSA